MRRRIAFVHPGQGSHRPGMAGVWAGTPGAEVIERIGRGCGLDLRALGDDADACGASTAVGQPAILAASLAATDALAAAGVVPDVVAGHSLGELTAAATAGMVDLDTVGMLAGERGRAMGDACRTTPGSMAAVVKLDRAVVDGIVAGYDGVAIANENALGQVVVSGADDQFPLVLEGLKAAGGRCIPLKVEGAFHSPAMTPAVVRLASALRRAELAEPTVPVVSGLDGRVVRTASDLSRCLVDGILAPVRWVDVQDRLLAMGVDVLVEVGPGGVLAALARRAHPDLLVASVARPEDVTSLLDLLDGAPVEATASADLSTPAGKA